MPPRDLPTSLRPPKRGRKLLAVGAAALTVLSTVTTTALLTAAPAAAADAAATPATTAWQNGSLQFDSNGLVSRSDLILGQPNTNPTASMPLGNGALGVSAWAANGFTAQLNRSDTMPARKSPGQLNIPGLSVITHAPDFAGKLDLTDGVLIESGGGMTMKAWVASTKDELIVDVTGADPAVTQTASINLWSGRHPVAAVAGTVGTLAETWVDNTAQGNSGKTFGSLAAISAGGQGVTTAAVNSTQVQTSFKPNSDGSFRVVVASPSWDGSAGDPGQAATAAIGGDATATTASLLTTQTGWWNTFWKHSGLIEMNSTDGNAAYTENLRTLYLYEENASMKAGSYPGSQAGEADMFAWNQDQQTWDPSSFWLWNLRAEISANMSSGNYQLNTPIFDMYINDLSNIEAWTHQQMGGLPGACVPEVMRFNGNGGDPGKGANSGCSEPGAPNWNALDISSGPELSLYMWEQYQATGDLAFLKRAFPFMEATAQFLLAYQTVGSDGLLHANANAHETQWSVQDPTTDITSDASLFPVIASAAALVGDDAAGDPLLGQFATAIPQIPPYPRTDQATRQQLLNPAYSQAQTTTADATGADMIAISYQPAAARQNGENIELEPLWPWNQVSDQDSNLFQLEQRSYTNRPNKGGNDWSLDAIDAARLQQPAQVESNLVSITKSHQVYPNGFADLGSTVGFQPYIEQSASVAAATDEALAQGLRRNFRGSRRPGRVTGTPPGSGLSAEQLQGRRPGGRRPAGDRRTGGRLHRHPEGEKPMEWPAGRGRRRQQPDHCRGPADQRFHHQRAGHRGIHLPDRAGVSSDHRPGVRSGHRHGADCGPSSGRRLARARRGRHERNGNRRQRAQRNQRLLWIDPACSGKGRRLRIRRSDHGRKRRRPDRPDDHQQQHVFRHR